MKSEILVSNKKPILSLVEIGQNTDSSHGYEETTHANLTPVIIDYFAISLVKVWSKV